MQHIRVDYRRPAPPAPRRGNGRSPRCGQHPSVHMVLAGHNPRWNTVRYLCPMCNAMGRPPVEVATGVVSAYWPDRGYGFIETGGPRIFFHVSGLAGRFTPFVGMTVTCQVEENAKGLIGKEVRPQ